MSTISASEIKRRGVSAIESVLDDSGEAVVTVRGKNRYVVMTMAKYNELRNTELAQAVRESREDYAAGRITNRTIKEHMQRLNDEV